MNTNWTRIAAVLGFLGVGLGAFGAHGLEKIADPEQLEWWGTATLYHLLHVAPLRALDARRGQKGTQLAGRACVAGHGLPCRGRRRQHEYSQCWSCLSGIGASEKARNQV